jgi:pyruvate/2-oxoglutarate dehydrogenase complex dihydrolipoamide acyltransferase (E2) component
MRTSSTEKLSEAIAEVVAETEAGGPPPVQAAKKPAAKKATKPKYTGKRKAPKPAPKKKAAAPKPAAKPAGKPAADDAVIAWQGKDNPFRPGSGRHERTERLRKHSGKTVAQFLAAGGKRGTIAKCKSMGLVKIT